MVRQNVYVKISPQECGGTPPRVLGSQSAISRKAYQSDSRKGSFLVLLVVASKGCGRRGDWSEALRHQATADQSFQTNLEKYDL